jgi:hypothetical protein
MSFRASLSVARTLTCARSPRGMRPRASPRCARDRQSPAYGGQRSFVLRTTRPRRSRPADVTAAAITCWLEPPLFTTCSTAGRDSDVLAAAPPARRRLLQAGCRGTPKRQGVVVVPCPRYADLRLMQLQDLARVFGGCIREFGDRRWLDTRVGGLRAFIIDRAANSSGGTFDLAVFTPRTRELDPFFSRDEGQEWRLEGEHVLPHLTSGFLFAGCRRGILFATSMGEPSLDSMVSTLWDLAEWARKRWHPAHDSPEYDEFCAGERARVRRERWVRIGCVALVVALVLWLRGGAPSLVATLALLAGCRPVVDGIGTSTAA